MKDSKEMLAVHIAAVVMEAAGLCIREERDLCESETTQERCTACIESWILQKAAGELQEEGSRYGKNQAGDHRNQSRH